MAARLLALAYLLCVLAPALSFAFADGAQAVPGLTEGEQGLGVVHIHEHAAGAGQHVHADGDSRHDSTITHASRHDADTPTEPASYPDHKSANGHCCGLVCVSALPATTTEIARPSAPRSICVSADHRAVADNTPQQRYRPPIG